MHVEYCGFCVQPRYLASFEALTEGRFQRDTVVLSCNSSAHACCSFAVPPTGHACCCEVFYSFFCMHACTPWLPQHIRSSTFFRRVLCIACGHYQHLAYHVVATRSTLSWLRLTIASCMSSCCMQSAVGSPQPAGFCPAGSRTSAHLHACTVAIRHGLSECL